MNSYILSIHNKWVEQIRKCNKKYEFRSIGYNNIKQGDKIYICETKRIEHFSRIGQGYLYCAYCGTKDFNKKCISLVTGEFIVKKVIATSEIFNFINHESNKNQTLAFEISDLKMYIRPKLLEEFNFKTAPQFYYKVKDNE